MKWADALAERRQKRERKWDEQDDQDNQDQPWRVTMTGVDLLTATTVDAGTSPRIVLLVLPVLPDRFTPAQTNSFCVSLRTFNGASPLPGAGLISSSVGIATSSATLTHDLSGAKAISTWKL